MKRMGMVIVVLALSAGPAAAQNKFDDVASKAKPVAGLWELGALLWTQLGSCGKMTNDLDRRQCEGVQKRRLQQIGGKTYLLSGGSAPVKLGAFNEKKKSSDIELMSCLACTESVDVDGEKLHIVGPGAVKVEGGAVEAAALHTTSQTFKDQKEYDAWKQDVLPRVKTEFVVKVDGAKRWKKGGAEGVSVEVVAYRAYDPCTGEVLAGKPASAKLTADARACGDKAKEEPVEPEKVVEVKPKEPELPYRLSPFQINASMAPVRQQSNKCFDAYGVPGKASYQITIGGDGKVSDVKETGDFVDTPTGKCIQKSIRGVQFKKFKKQSITFDFPVVLQ